MNDLPEQLTTLGFKQLPDFDPDYFQHRHRVGFLLLINHSQKLKYQIFTINALSCLATAQQLINGEQANRSQALQEALRKSHEDDWEIYFRPHGLYPGLRVSVNELFAEYRSLNTITQRVDMSEATWAYQIFHEDFARLIAVTSNKPLTEELAIGKFLQKWRKSLEDSLNRRKLGLARYYLGCDQLAQATQQWIKGETKNFAIVEIQKVAGKPRREVSGFTAVQNAKMTIVYRQTLAV